MTNTGDKFLTGEDRAEWIKLVDIFTDHYVPPRTCYGPMLAKYWGKENTDTESWIAANELLLPQVMCQFLACGQDRVTPWHPAMTYYSVPGSPMKYHLPHPVALATNVFNVFCTGRPFQRLLLLDHLPWAFQFGTGNDAVVVLLPRVLAYFGSGSEDVLWWQFNVDEGGTLTIDNSDGALEIYDVAGNREFEGEKQMTVPVDYLAAQVNDPSDYPGHQQLEAWDETQYFRGAEDDAICESLRPFEKFVLANMNDKATAEQLKKDPQWDRYQQFLEKHPDAANAVRTRAANVYFRAKKRNPQATFADASYVYKKTPRDDFPWSGDTLQFGFDVLEGYAHHQLKTDEDRVPIGFHAMPDTDYEYTIYACNDGGSELWRLLAPGVPRGHHYPRQPRAKFDQGPVKQGKHVVRRQRGVTTYELAIPWSELTEWRPQAGQKFGFTFRVNNNQGPALLFAAGKSATKTNGLSLHPYWEGKLSCSVQWALRE